MFGSVRRSSRFTLVALLAGGAVLAGAAAALAPAPPLSARRFAAIDRLLKASGPLEAREVSDADRERFVRACRSLSTTDPLLRAQRARCQAVIDASAADKALSTCGSYEECASKLRPLRDAFDREISATRQLNVAVRREVTDRRCRAALLVPASDLRLLDAYARELTNLQSAYAEGSEQLVERALARLAEIPLGDQRSVRRQRADLRSACR